MYSNADNDLSHTQLKLALPDTHLQIPASNYVYNRKSSGMDTMTTRWQSIDLVLCPYSRHYIIITPAH